MAASASLDLQCPGSWGRLMLLVHGPHSENPARTQHARTATRNMPTPTHHALDGFLSEVCLCKSQWAHSLKCIYFAVCSKEDAI